jgi:hypothetical protein
LSTRLLAIAEYTFMYVLDGALQSLTVV